MKTKTYKMAVGILAIFLLNFLISTGRRILQLARDVKVRR